jgi:putative colanic acid biosynthesis UDP-glucose lipid carrier transferase
MTRSGMIRQHQSKLSFLQRVMDALVITLSLFPLIQIRGIAWTTDYTVLVTFTVAVFFFLAESRELYRSWRGIPITMEIRRIGNAWILTVLVLLLIAFFTKSTEAYSRFVIISWFVLTPISLSIFRIALRRTLKALRVLGRNTRSVAVVGSGEIAKRLARSILDHPWTGLNLVGFYTDAHPKGYQPLDRSSLSVVGTLGDLVNEANRIDLIYVALPMREESKIKELVQNVSNTTSSLYLVPDLFTFDLLHSRWSELAGIPVISIFESPFIGIEGWIKRMEDLVIGTTILLLMAIPMTVIGIIIKVTSEGPVIYRQKRYGLNGEEIIVWKFRTMTVMEEGEGVAQARKGDPRVTIVGKFLRRTSLDELPQFINVLQGRMSIVGPRPHAVAHNEKYRELVPSYMMRHKVKPGITGLAQVNGWRGETDTLEKMEKRVQFDLEYIRNWSMLLDLEIIFLTVLHGFRHKNAY